MPVTKAIDWKGKKPIGDFLSDYSVYRELTAELDAQHEAFGETLINKIVLWKLSRYVKIPPATLAKLDGVRAMRQGEHRKAAEVLEQLLACKGVRLPMASTILRFANPNVFQIYDRHICRALTGMCNSVAPKAPTKALELYWTFLDELVRQCSIMRIEFRDADRILFEFDKQVNPSLASTED